MALFVVFGLLLLLSGRGLSQGSGYFWHITDMHWDPTYLTDDKALSCNPGTTGNTFGKYGDFRCDPPWQLINSSVHAMRTIKPDVDFLIWTGDDTPHIWNDTILHKEAVSKIVLQESDILQDVFPEVRVYSALGNHDWSPKNQLPPRPDPFYDVIAGKWEPWMDEAANETFRKAGYYTMLVNDNVRMVVLNTNLYYTSNSLTEDMPDPANQLQWMDDAMTEALLANEKVIVIAHVPPGMFEKHANKSWFYPFYNEVFLSLLRKHAQVITGIHMAHHHTDSFRVLYRDGDPVSAIFLAPAVTPWETTLAGTMGGLGNNPSIRLVQYDTMTGRTLDIHQYYLNLTAANTINAAQWQLEYRAKEYFEIPNLEAASLHSLVERMRTDNALFGKYYSANGVLYDPDEIWSENIRKIQLCAVANLDYDKYNECVNPSVTASAQMRDISSLTFFIPFLTLFTHCK